MNARREKGRKKGVGIDPFSRTFREGRERNPCLDDRKRRVGGRKNKKKRIQARIFMGLSLTISILNVRG